MIGTIPKQEEETLPHVRAVIWDVDGTMVDTEREGHRIAFNLAFRDLGLDWHWDEETYRRLLAVAGGKERLRYAASLAGIPMSEDQIRAIHHRKTEHFKRLLASSRLPLRPGVRRLLNEIHAAGIPQGVATTMSEEALDALIRHCLGEEWLHRFAVRAAGDIVPVKKPAPDIYLWALKRMGEPPQSSIAIEDSEHGLAAAKAAGLACIVTVNDYTREQRFDGADLVVSALGEEEGEGIEVIANPHGLRNLHHVRLKHLEEIVHA